MQPSAIIDASSGLGKDYVDYVLNYACKRGAGLSMDTVGPTPWRQKSSLSQLYVGSQRGVPGKKKEEGEGSASSSSIFSITLNLPHLFKCLVISRIFFVIFCRKNIKLFVYKSSKMSFECFQGKNISGSL